MKNKKIISAVLTLALAASSASLLSGCKGSVVYVDGNGNPTDPPQSAAPADTSSQTESTPADQNSSADTSTAETSAPAEADAVNASQFGLTANIEDGTILHAWSWSFNTIKESMADIAAAGYSSIQTSPANTCVVGEKGGMQLYGKGKWYYHYQPTDWKVGNYQLGTEEEFKAMCDEAEKYGIKIIVDVVPNHTANDKRKVEQDFIDAVGGQDKLYHKNYTKAIGNYGDRLQCTTYTLTGLHDVNTENPQFQEYFLKYMNQLIADGADGFRYDTAKHIGLPDDPQEDPSLPNNFWDIIKKTDKADTIFNYGEVLQGDNERVADYIKTIGHTTASLYGGAVRGCIQRGKMLLLDLEDFKVGGSDKVVTWVESHDNYTGDDSYKMTEDQIILGWAVIAGNGKGTPLFFDRPYGSSPDNQWGDMNRIGAAGSDLYKNETVVALNRFRNAMVGEDTELTNPGNKSALMIARGSKGVVLVNAGKKDIELDTETKLADGTYTDKGKQNGDFTAAGGKLTGTLKAGSCAVLYNEGYTDPVEMPKVSMETGSFDLSGGNVTVTLHVSGADSGSYDLNGTSATFADGDTVEITAGENGEGVLRLSATGSSGLTTNHTYWFTGGQAGNTEGSQSEQSKAEEAPADGTVIKFQKPEKWGDSINVYIYQKDPLVNVSEWPGEAMTKNDDGTYSYVFKSDEVKEPLLVFNDGKKQYPKSGGLELEEGKLYTVE